MAEYIERTEELILAMNAGARAIETRSVITVLFTPRMCSRKAHKKSHTCWLPKCCGK